MTNTDQINRAGYGKGWDPADHYHDRAIATNYDRQRFSSLAGRLFNWLERRLIRRCFADLPRTSAIVDVPCGTGRLAEVLLEAGFAVTGLDISQSMLDVASQRLRRFGSQFQAVVVDGRKLPESGLSFDAALCARVLMHFPLDEQREFLRSVASIAGQRVVFTQGMDTAYHRLRRRLKRLLGNQAPAVYPLTPSDLQSLVASAGLRIVRRHAVLPVVSEAFVAVCVPSGQRDNAASPGRAAR